MAAIVSAAVALAWLAQAAAQESPPAAPPAAALPQRLEGEAPLRFRRVYVPADRIDDLARDTIPLRRERFEEMVAAFSAHPAAVQRNRLRSCLLGARLEDDRLVGVGQFEVRRSDPPRSFLSLAPCRLPIVAAWWTDAAQDVEFGYDPAGRLGALIDRAGSLQCQWSLPGETLAPGRRVYSLTLPASPLNKVALILPADQTPSASRGLLQKVASLDAAEWNWWDETAVEMPDGHALWLLELGGATQTELTLELPPDKRPAAARPGFRQQTSYQLSLHDTRVRAEIYLDRTIQRLGALEVEWPASLSLLSAKAGRQDLTWRIVASNQTPPAGEPDGGDATTRRAEIDLPAAAASGVPISLTFSGEPIREQRQALPAVTLANAYWREGQATVEVMPPLVLSDLEVASGVVETASQAEPVEGQRLDFRLLNENAEIRAATRLRHPMAEADTVSLLEFDGEGVRGKMFAEVVSSRGELFQLSAQIGSQWTIDSVEALAGSDADPEAALADSTAETPAADLAWNDVLRDWNIGNSSTGRQTLEIRLQSALRPGRPVRLAIGAHHRNAALEGTVSLSELDFLVLDTVANSRQIFALRAESALQLGLESAGAARLVEEIDDELYAGGTDWDDYPLVLEASGRHASHAAGAKLSLRRAKPRYTGEISTHWRVGEQAITARHRVRCTPQSGSVATVLVRGASRPDDDLQWRLEGDANVLLTPKLLHDDHEASVWEIGVYPSRSKPFTLIAEQQVARSTAPATAGLDAKGQRLGLLSLPEAESQTGLVEIEAARPEVTFRLLHRGLTPSPVVASHDAEQPTLYSRFRYRSDESHRLEIVSDEAPELPLLKVWNLEVHSLIAAHHIRHVATYRLENRGAATFAAMLPADVTLSGLLVGQEKVASSEVPSPSRRVQVNLPADQRFVTVSLSYEEPVARGWMLWRRLEAKVPETVESPLQARWILHASPQLALWNGDDLSRPYRPADWRHRLLGPLAPPPGSASDDVGAPRFSHRAAAGEQPAGEPLGAGPSDSPWQSSAGFWAASRGDNGWPRVELPLGQGSTGRLTLTRPSAWSVLSTSLLLIVAGLSLLICRRRPRRIVLVLGVTGALCLFSPAMCAVAGSGMFLGALLAAAMLAVARVGVSAEVPSAAAAAPREASTKSAASLQQLTVWLMLSLALGVGGRASWQGAVVAAQEAEGRRSPTYQVFIPVDENEVSQGNYVHLPEAFYQALHRRFLDHRSPPAAWLLHSAEYTCLVDRSGADPLSVDELRVALELNVLRNDTAIVLPFRADQLELADGGVTLDGAPREATWSDDGRSLRIGAVATGRHRLKLYFRPAVVLDSGRPVVQVDMPPAADSRLEILHSTGLSGFRLKSGGVLTETSPGRTAADLGPVAAWALELPSASGPGRSLAAEQLWWLRLQPGAAVWDMKCRYTPTANSTGFVEWEVDPNLRLLTVTVDGAEYAKHSRWTQRNLIRIDLIEPVEEPFTVEAKFIQEDFHGIGRLRMPLLRALAAQQDRRWLAVSGDESLEIAVEHDTSAEALAANDFLASWRSEAAPPRRAYRLLTPDPQWEVRSMPLRTAAKVRTLTTASLGGGSVELEHEVAFPASQRPRRLYQLQLPPQFQVRSATLHQAGRSQKLNPVARDDRLLIVLPAPVAGEHRLALELSGPAAEGEYQLPWVKLAEADVSQAEYRIYRQEEVQVEAPRSAALRAQNGSSGGNGGNGGLAAAEPASYSPRLGRLVAVLTPGDSNSETGGLPKVRVTKNDPRLQQGEMVMALRRQERLWRLNVTLQGTLESGSLDCLRLFAPDHLAPPTIESPAAALEVVPLPGESRVQWVIRPQQPLSGDFAVELSTPLEFEPGVSPRLPAVEVAGGVPLTTYVMLPRQAGDQQATWSVTNLIPAQPPRRWDDSPWLPSAGDSYRAEADYAARLSLEPSRRLEPQVRLADMLLVVHENQSYFGAASFDLEPGGLSRCRLRLAAETQLLQVQLDGAPVAVRGPLEGSGDQANDYEVHLGEASLPHRLEVLFEGPPSRSAAEGPLRAPVPLLPEIPVERTLWTVYAPPGVTIPVADQPWGELHAERHWAYRLQAAVALSEPPAHLLASVSQQDIAPWYRKWANRVSQYYHRGRAAGNVAGAEPEHPFDAEFLRERREMAARMGLESEFEAALSTAPAGQWQLAEIAAEVAASQRPAWRAMSQGAPEQLLLSAPPRSDSGVMSMLAGVALLAAAGGSYRLLRGRSLTEWMVWWIYPVGVLLGIAWWLWLSPAAVGWVIVAVSLAGSLRSPWRTQAVTPAHR